MSIGRVRTHRRRFEISWKFIFKIFSLMIFISSLSFILFITNQANYFPIRNVKIIGAHHIDHDVIHKLVLPLVSNGFFAADKDKIKERLLQLTWTRHVIVRRVWPDSMIVEISEKEPVAEWNENSLLSSTGELFTPETKTFPKGLPKLIGPLGEQIFMAQYYAKMNSILMPLHSRITRLELTPAMAWGLTLDNGVKLTIGHKDILTRLHHFVKVYAKIVGDNASNVEYVDLRYPNGMAVKWKSIT